jgi:hypothetical protein
MDVFKNGGLGYLAGFLILAALIVAIVLTTGSSSSGGSSSSPEAELEWVAVGDDGSGYGNIMYSSDGQSWTKTSTGDSFSGLNSIGWDVAYGTCNGTPLWVAVGNGDDDGNRYGNIMYSSDGQSWTKTSTGDSFSTVGYGVAYGTCNGTPLWVAVGDGDADGNKYGNIMYSSDGQCWSKTSTGDSFSARGRGIAYGTCNGTSLWVAVGDDTGYGNIMYSSDGQSWTKTSTGDSFSTNGYGVAYGTCNGTPLWVAVGSDGTNRYGNIMYSSDGQSWTKTSTGDNFNGGYGVAYGTCNGTSLWVAVGSDSGGGYGTIMYSNDGQSWTKTSTGDSFSTIGYGVAYGTCNGSPLWVAVGNDSTGYGRIMYSSDGQSWTKTSTGDSFSEEVRSVAAKHLLYGMSPGYYHPQ